MLLCCARTSYARDVAERNKSGLRVAGFVLSRGAAAVVTLYAVSLTTRMWSGPVGEGLARRTGAPLSLVALLCAWVATGVFLEIAGTVRELRGDVDREDARQQWARTLGGVGLVLVSASFVAAALFVFELVDVSGALPIVLAGAGAVIGATWVACAELVATLAARR